MKIPIPADGIRVLFSLFLLFSSSSCLAALILETAGSEPAVVKALSLLAELSPADVHLVPDCTPSWQFETDHCANVVLPDEYGDRIIDVDFLVMGTSIATGELTVRGRDPGETIPVFSGSNKKSRMSVDNASVILLLLACGSAWIFILHRQ